jgi:hypothetical protein
VKKPSLRDWARFFWALPVAAAVAAILGFLAVSLSRIGYPFALEWMEGGSVDLVRRILSGQSIYVAPSLDYVPFIYTPLYFYASALTALLLGEGFLPVRLLSLLSTLGSLATLFVLVRHEARDRIAALVATGLFAGTFAASGAWFDLARVDSFFLALFAASVAALRLRATRGGFLIAGALLALSFLTKQTALVAGLPLILFALVVHGRLGLWFAGSFAAVAGGASLGFQTATRPWYLHYLLLPAGDVWVWERARGFVTQDLLATMPVACAAALALLVLFSLRRQRESLLFWGIFGGGVLAATFFSRGRSGGYLNVLMPLHWFLAAAFGVALGEARGMRESSLPAGGSSGAGQLAALGAAAASLLQLALLAYDPRPLIPAEQDRAAGAEVIEMLRSAEGEVLLPLHAYLAGLAGKRVYLQGNAGLDELRAVGDPARESLIDSIEEAIHERRFEMIILDRSGLLRWNRFEPIFRDALEESYEESGPVLSSRKVFWTVTGVRTRPDVVWRPRRAGFVREP